MMRIRKVCAVLILGVLCMTWRLSAAEKKGKKPTDRSGKSAPSSSQDSMKSMEKQEMASLTDMGDLLDGFEANDWVPSNSDGASVKISYVPGKVDKAISMDYSLKDSKQWVAIIKDIAIKTKTQKAVQFYLKHAGTKKNKLEIKLIDDDGTNYGVKADLKPNMDWEKVTLDMTDFVYWWGGDARFDNIKQIGFAVSPEEAGSGTVFLDELRIVPSKYRVSEKIKFGIIDDCDSTKGWKAEADQGATAALNTWFGKEKDALVLKYDLSSGNWVQLYKMIPLELNQNSIFSFYMKWTGDLNAVEFKIADFDRSNFGRKFENIQNPDQWQEIKIPVSELQYLYGGDKDLDMKNIIGIWIAVTKVKGGKGTLAVDSLKLQ